MLSYSFIKEKFFEKHKVINNEYYLDKYINFLINYKLEKDIEYSEIHHILPKSTFPEFKEEKWNMICLDYDSHILVHLWIFKAVNDRRYQRPLNWMMNFYKNSEEISNAAKRGWENLKKDSDKYKKWIDSRSDYMRGLSSEEQSRRAKIFWDNISDSEHLEFCNKMKSYWTEEKRKQKSADMLKYYSDPKNINRKKEESTKVWASRDENFRDNFAEKMRVINNLPSKKIDAGFKIKELWKNGEYLEKMKNRKHRSGKLIKLLKGNNEEEIFESMSTLSKKYDISLYLIRKYMNKNKKLMRKDLSEKNISLVDSIIETIN